ncbi:tryptophan synthase subunit alpha [Corynebacterium sp. H128]|uniref:tryptophan synthase subunit alpha n=1 Tax=Corynebacterium sp. H128 TaxID=3133427 RepID=UPI0030A3BDC0
MDRYAQLFAQPGGKFVPFVMLGDPGPAECLKIIDTLIAAGADALELGIPFSDPVADGPTIQRSHLRASATDVHVALDLIAQIRAKYPALPIGLLVYGNVAFSLGFDEFYGAVAAAGADSVLIPDVPIRESRLFREAARRHGVQQVFIAPPHSSLATLTMVAEHSEGYIYAVSRNGVTGTEREASMASLSDVVANATTPVLLGFGISTPEHVRAAIESGANGAIVGSALVKLIEHYEGEELLLEMAAFARELKAATESR